MRCARFGVGGAFGSPMSTPFSTRLRMRPGNTANAWIAPANENVSSAASKATVPMIPIRLITSSTAATANWATVQGRLSIGLLQQVGSDLAGPVQLLLATPCGDGGVVAAEQHL